MALSAKSLFLYGFEINVTNQYLDFKIGPSTTVTATLAPGFYSLTTLMAQIASAMTVADGSATVYTVTADRTIAGGTQNRVTISSNGSYLQLLFGSGAHFAASIASSIGFNASDYTGGLTYAGSASAGTALIPTREGYNYLGPDRNQKVFGAVNVSATGDKESIVYQIQKFWDVEFRYEPNSKVINEWNPFFAWAIQMRRLEFTPEISNPTVFYEGTLEKTNADGKGLGFRMPEMLPNFPGLFQTGAMTFRQSVTASQFIL